jgi:hypothetical protein
VIGIRHARHVNVIGLPARYVPRRAKPVGSLEWLSHFHFYALDLSVEPSPASAGGSLFERLSLSFQE